jgi:hypothetical protein
MTIGVPRSIAPEGIAPSASIRRLDVEAARSD